MNNLVIVMMLSYRSMHHLNRIKQKHWIRAFIYAHQQVISNKKLIKNVPPKHLLWGIWLCLGLFFNVIVMQSVFFDRLPESPWIFSNISSFLQFSAKEQEQCYLTIPSFRLIDRMIAGSSRSCSCGSMHHLCWECSHIFSCSVLHLSVSQHRLKEKWK